MASRSSVAINTAKTKKLASKEANLMRTIGCSVEYLNGEKRFPFYVEEAIKNGKRGTLKMIMEYLGSDVSESVGLRQLYQEWEVI